MKILTLALILIFVIFVINFYSSSKSKESKIIPGNRPQPKENIMISNNTYPAEITKDAAFEAIKNQLNASSTFTNESQTFDLSFLKDTAHWNDPVKENFTALEPELIDGKDFINYYTSNYSYRILYGKPESVVSNKKYWVFTWNRPGVLDKRYIFLVDASDAKLIFITQFQSPD